MLYLINLQKGGLSTGPISKLKTAHLATKAAQWFQPIGPHGGKRELTLASCHLTTPRAPKHACECTCVQTQQTCMWMYICTNTTNKGSLREMSPRCLRHLNSWSPVVSGCLGKFRRWGLARRSVSMALRAQRLMPFPVFLLPVFGLTCDFSVPAARPPCQDGCFLSGTVSPK